ncbi:MAG: hypothetical protein R6U10_03120 [Thermoplasmatota archaeon]
MHPFVQRLLAFAGRLRRSPRLLGALVVLAVLIFVVLLALMMVTTPEHSFTVTCVECNGRYGDLVVVEGESMVTRHVEAVVRVSDEDGLAVANASVTLHSGDDEMEAKTNLSGVVRLAVNVTLPADVMETYLSLSASKSNFHDYSSDAVVTVVRQ